MLVGVLALQGDFHKHCEMLDSINVASRQVRKKEELESCDGLIIPGGESTTMMRQIEMVGLRSSLEEFAKSKPIFGTCAGLILMSHAVSDFCFKPFGWLNIEVERNAFGRQVDSFSTPIHLLMDTPEENTIDAFFIRAPKIRSWSESVRILAFYHDEPILVQEGHFLGASFHPELTHHVSIHKHFVSMIESV